MKMRASILLLASISLGVGLNSPAHAIGCISGGVAGAVAGHMVHHGVLGALGGCIAGHHVNKSQKRAAQAQRDQQYQPAVDQGTQQRQLNQ